MGMLISDILYWTNFYIKPWHLQISTRIPNFNFLAGLVLAMSSGDLDIDN